MLHQHVLSLVNLNNNFLFGNIIKNKGKIIFIHNTFYLHITFYLKSANNAFLGLPLHGCHRFFSFVCLFLKFFMSQNLDRKQNRKF